MISIQSYRVSIGLFQFKLKNVKAKNSTYENTIMGKGGKEKISARGGKFNFKIILLFFLLGLILTILSVKFARYQTIKLIIQ